MGASISLVAGAALALLVVSFVVAYDGLAGGADLAAPNVALRLQGQTTATQDRVTAPREVAAVIAAAPATQARSVAAETVAPARGLREGSAAQARPAPVANDVPILNPQSDPVTASDPAASKSATGDGVRDLGAAVSTTVEDTGSAAGDAAAPLGPPVSQAVQDVLNVVNSLLQGATSGIAGTLDKALPR